MATSSPASVERVAASAAGTTLTATARVAREPTKVAKDAKSGRVLSVAQTKPSSRRQRIVLLPQSMVSSCGNGCSGDGFSGDGSWRDWSTITRLRYFLLGAW